MTIDEKLIVTLLPQRLQYNIALAAYRKLISPELENILTDMLAYLNALNGLQVATQPVREAARVVVQPVREAGSR